MKMKAVLLALGIATSACSSGPTGPTTVAVQAHPTPVGYDINIPDVALSITLRNQFPNGVHIPPIEAQQRWEFSGIYGGSPNVYFGPIAPKCQTYFGTGIVIAPASVASRPTFTAADWPAVGFEAGVTYEWVGRFTYSVPAAKGTFTIDPACK